MTQIRFPIATFLDWTAPALPRPGGIKRVSERKQCAHVILGEVRRGTYHCFDPTETLSSYYGRFGLSLAEGNYVQMASEILDLAPFEFGSPYLPFERLPAALKVHFEKGGRLYWSQCYSVAVSRQWQRLHGESRLLPGAAPLQRTISQAEGVSLSRVEIASRIASWEFLRDMAVGDRVKGGGDLLSLEELGREIEAVVRAGEANAGVPTPCYKAPTALHPAVSHTFNRAFAVPASAEGLVDETYNQLREVLDFHQVWYIGATPFDLEDGLEQTGVFALTLPVSAGSAPTHELVIETDTFEVGRFTPA